MITNNIRTQTFSVLVVSLVMGLTLFNLNCSAFQTNGSETEDIALKALRDMTKNGKLPPESMVLQIENRYGATRTGALARLLRGRIHFENNDLLGAAAILNSEIFRQKTSVGDYALWLRGKALFQMNKTDEAMAVFAELAREFPNSMRTREARLLWAQGALQTGKAGEVPEFLRPLTDKNDADALLLTAKSFDARGLAGDATTYYRRVYFYGAGSGASTEAEAKLTSLGDDLNPRTADELTARAERFYKTGKYAEALAAFDKLVAEFPGTGSPVIELKRLNTALRLRKLPEALTAFNRIPSGADEKPEASYRLALGYAGLRNFGEARNALNEMRQKFPASNWTPKALVDTGLEARDQKNRAEESYFLKTAVDVYPNAVEVADAQFELAWIQHEQRDFQTSTRMLTEHLARYAHEDTTNRGKAGYWAARDSERIGKTNEACALYHGVSYRYGANWYGYLALQRIENMGGRCQTTPDFAVGSLINKAVENLKVVTVAPETATQKELARAENADDLSVIGLFDWAIEELKEAKKTADNSPKINLALAQFYRFKGDNVSALLALKPSYPDYSQMFPEEMGREEWDIFYPLTHWNDITLWGERRRLDPYQIAGFIRQETIFNPTAKSSANAYGMMQLLVPTARSMARKYSADAGTITGSTLFNASLNIELGTAYMRDQFDKYGRLEYVAVAYNAGPGRVVTWRRTLPGEMDEFVEEIPFRETRNYVQGIIRNSAQYRRLYELDGSLKSNVGTRPVRGAIDTLPRDQFAKEYPEIFLDSRNRAE